MLASAVVVWGLVFGAPSPPRAPLGPAVGMALGRHAPATSLLLFADAARRADGWRSVTPEPGGFATGDPVPLDRRGMPTGVPVALASASGPGAWVRTRLFDGRAPRIPPGAYTLAFTGTGVVRVVRGERSLRFERPGRVSFVLPGEVGGLALVIERSDPEDPIRDLRLALPATSTSARLHPGLVRRLTGFSVLRVGSGAGHPCRDGRAPSDPRCRMAWTDRVAPDALAQGSAAGVAYEHLLDLSAATGADAWLTVPHAADDDFVARLAALARSRLPPGRRVYLELAGPHRPGPARAYFAARASRVFAASEIEGASAGRAPAAPDARSGTDPRGDDGLTPPARAWLARLVEVWAGFEAALDPGGALTLVRVVGSDFGRPERSRALLTALAARAEPGRPPADALAVDAYFGPGVERALAETDPEAGPEAVLDRLERSLLGPGGVGFEALVRAQAEVAAAHGAALVAREGGPHPRAGLDRPTPVAAAVDAAQRSARMAQLYLRALQLWFEHGGTTFVASELLAPAAPTIGTGHLEALDQPLERAPKLGALRVMMRRLGQPLGPAVLGLSPARGRWLFVSGGGPPGVWLLPADGTEAGRADRGEVATTARGDE